MVSEHKAQKRGNDNKSKTPSRIVTGEILKPQPDDSTKSKGIATPISTGSKSAKSKAQESKKEHDHEQNHSHATEIRRLGKDELNLIEHPFAILWQKEARDAVIYYQWDAKHPITGRVLPASWMVSGHRDFGLPNAADERVYLVLLEVTREAGFEQQNVSFSRYDLLQRLGWNTDHRSYDMLERAFERLQGVTITAKNAFWNPKTRSFVNTGFNIIDNYHIESERPGRKAAGQRELPVSFWRWNDVIFASFQSGYLRTLDLDFALGLKSDIALRLYRYLDKKAYAERDTFEIELFNLCIRHLGMKPNRYPSKLKERLKPAHEELIARGFLQSVEYQPMKTQKGLKVCYRFAPGGSAHRGQETLKSPEAQKQERSPHEQNSLLLIEPVTNEITEEIRNVDAGTFSEVLDPSTGTQLQDHDLTQHRLEQDEPPSTNLKAQEGDSHGGDLTALQQQMLSRMVALKVSPEVARKLLQEASSETLQSQLDCLDDREPRDRAATFVKSVREGWELPGKYLERIEVQERAQKQKASQESEKLQAARQEALAREEKASEEDEAQELDALWKTLDASSQQNLENEARQRLGILGQTGRAQGALQAMRRNLLRERLGKM